MYDNVIRDAWELARLAIELLIYIGISWLIISIFHETLGTLFRDAASELKNLAELKPTTRAVNMLFGILIFIVVILMLAAGEVEKAIPKRSPDINIMIPLAAEIIIGLFLLTVFFIISIAYCNKTRT